MNVGTTWNAEVSFRTVGKATFTDEIAEGFLEALADFAPAVAITPRVLTLSFSVDAGDDPMQASELAWETISEALGRVNPMVPLEVSRLELETLDELSERLERVDTPQLVGIAEIADVFDVSKQRASELSRSDAFPDPLAELAAGPVWARSSIERFREAWERRPGRPPNPGGLRTATAAKPRRRRAAAKKAPMRRGKR
jgi:hypothetical protein